MKALIVLSNTDVTLNRNQIIGGSDIATIMGMNRWKTPLRLWCEKTGRIEATDLSEVEAVQMGAKLEQFVANEFSVRTGKDVRRAPKAYQHPEYPYMVAHVDRLITGTDELLECKTCSLFKKEEWENDEIPQEYIMQVMWYLGITGRKVGYIACLIGGQSFVYKKIDFDAEMFDIMVKFAIEFHKHVVNNEPVGVSANDDDTLKEMYGMYGNSEVFIELYPDDEETTAAMSAFESKVAHLQEVKREIAEADKEKRLLEQEIKAIIADNLGVKTPSYCVTWKWQNGPYSYDKAAMESDGVLEKYATRSVNRVLRIAKNKEYV